MLVVLTVIMVLMAILIPAMTRSRRVARATECLGSIRQLGTAVLLYADSNDGYLPNHNDNNFGSNWDRAMFLCYTQYGSNFEVLHCMRDEFYEKPPAGYGAAFPYQAGAHYWSYCYNMRMAAEWPDLTAPSTVQLKAFVEPAKTITFFEGEEADGGVENDGADGPVDNPYMDPYIRHLRGASYLFADAHAERLQAGTLTLPQFTTAAD